jgi:D-aspartate ligase
MAATGTSRTHTLPVAVVENPSSRRGEAGGVVVGGDYQGLGIVRSLGRQGLPVCIVDDEHSLSRFSRYCSQFVRVADLRTEQSIVDSLLEIGDRSNLHGWVLYPTRDEIVAAVSRNRSRLAGIFRVPTADWDSVQWAWDKRNTYELAQELRIPIPITKYPMNAAGLHELDGLEPPFAIKPAIKEHFIYAAKAKAWCANNHSELRRLFQKAAELMDPAEVMVQEVIPGGGSQQFSYCAFFREGKAIGKMVARRQRQHPILFGRATTYVETVNVPILEELSERFLCAINYYGLVEVEYKLDPRDSQYKLLDVNARTWGYQSLGAHAGVDFSHMLYQDQIGLPVPRCRGQSGVGWVRMTTDLPVVLGEIFAGNLGLRSYLRSLKGCSTEAVFSREDLLPVLAEIFLVPYLAFKRGF